MDITSEKKQANSSNIENRDDREWRKSLKAAAEGTQLIKKNKKSNIVYSNIVSLD